MPWGYVTRLSYCITCTSGPRVGTLHLSLLPCHRAQATSRLMTRAGLPTATARAGTDVVTTLPAPITAPSPIVTPG